MIGTLSFKRVDWASLDEELRAVREPQLLGACQVQNNLLFTISLGADNVPKAK